jgi:hypothetical protein
MRSGEAGSEVAIVGGMFFSRLATAVVGVVLVAHGLIHLFIWPGGVEGETGVSGWDGTARLPAGLSEDVVLVVGRGLVVLSVVLLVGAGLLWFRAMARAHVAGPATVAAGAVSLLTFAVLWPGMLPGPGEFWRGPVISGLAVLAGVSLIGVNRHRARGATTMPPDEESMPIL